VTRLLTPARHHGVEILDDPAVAPEVIDRSMKDVVRANLLFGGTRAAMAELEPALREIGGSVTMLDVGTGHGDIPAAARILARSHGIALRTFGIDMSQPLLAANRGASDAAVRGDALRLPFRDRSVDIAMASQVLHHFRGESAIALIREMNRVASRRVVISDLRRSLAAAAGLWLASFPLRFHPVSRHDGVVSVMRGFVPAELADIVEAATGHRPKVSRHAAFRLTTSWQPR
jgi:2-polyprenyl-3-methyl-5-hydroxy-6-metoxy-1,4-benzoquinol methylase